MKATTTSRREWMIPAGLILMSIVPAIGGAVRLSNLASGNITADNHRFFDMPLPIVLHVLTALPYSLLGALQFAPQFRKNHRPWHRSAGKVLVLCGFVVAVTGLWMAALYPTANHDGVAVRIERLIVGVWMTWSMMMGVDAIRRRRFNEHGVWMIRAYAIGMGAATQVFTHLPYFILIGQPGELGRGIMMGGAWAINFVVGEWIINKQVLRSARIETRTEALWAQAS